MARSKAMPPGEMPSSTAARVATSARAGQNNGMDFVLRNLRHLTHVPERGLKVLVGRRFGLISGHLDHCRHQSSHFA